MVTLLAIIALGFFLGMRHATDPDHVIAVSTIVSRERSLRHASLVGILWGLGHTLTIVMVGAAIILFSIVIPPRIGLTMELSVGLMLVLLGLMNLSGFTRWMTENLTPAAGGRPVIHAHPHAHGDYVHSHPHGHTPDTHGHKEDQTPQGWLDKMFGELGLYQVLRPLIVGVVHGLAGSAAVVLLVLTTIRNPVWAVAYLVVFGVGTIAGMMLITAAIAMPLVFGGDRFGGLTRYFATASGLVSLGFGLFLVYQIGFVQGLFTTHPQWTPH
ncbi:MAG TPA: high-affinity nickel-transport family protein [Terriglobia bacterium]|nr:high-affinity nickel-transport family protein [Terriglobia bacterium]